MEACRLCDRAARLFEDTPERQFARVAKGVDLRSTEGNFAWVRTPQLTTPWDFEGPCRLVVRTSRCGRDNPGSTPGVDTFIHVQLDVSMTAVGFEPTPLRTGA